MRHLSSRSILALAFIALALGCATGETGFFDGGVEGPSSADLGTGAGAEDATTAAVVVGASDDGGIVVLGPDDASGGEDGEASVPVLSGPPFDAGEAGVCTQALAAGSLLIVEIMIESTSGTGDHGEWLEVQSTLDCAVDLRGLGGECPIGAKVISFAITGDVWLPPRGTFIVADSSDPAIDHALPGAVVGWSGNPGDVLRNDGATVTLLLGSQLIDSITYPKLKLTPGVSIAFPADCPPALRSTWPDWQGSVSSWFPGFSGTPNAPNDDVHCPDQPDD